MSISIALLDSRISILNIIGMASEIRRLDLIRRDVFLLEDPDPRKSGLRVNMVGTIRRGPQYHLRTSAMRTTSSLSYMVSGRAEFIGERGPIPLKPGMVYAVAPQVAREVRSVDGKPHEIHWVTFHGRGAARAIPELLGVSSHAWPLSNPGHVADLFQLLLSEAQHMDAYVQEICSGHLMALLHAVRRGIAKQPGQVARSLSTFHSCRTYLERHADELTQAEEVATACGVTAVHLNRLFRTYAQTTPFAYLQKRKIQRARDLLLRTDWSVARISERLNFENPYGFSRTFKRITGQSPTEFRRA